MNREILLLDQLQNHAGYKHLEDLWRERISEIQEKRDTIASKNGQYAQESWKYWAGMEKGFKEAVTLLHVTLAEMESIAENQQADDRMATIAQELKGENK